MSDPRPPLGLTFRRRLRDVGERSQAPGDPPPGAPFRHRLAAAAALPATCAALLAGLAPAGAARAADNGFYLGAGATRSGRAVQSLYDPTPVIWLARPGLFELQPARVDVELQGRFTRGMTVCDLRAPAQARANAQVAIKADGPAALAWAMQRLEELLRR